MTRWIGRHLLAVTDWRLTGACVASVAIAAAAVAASPGWRLIAVLVLALYVPGASLETWAVYRLADRQRDLIDRLRGQLAEARPREPAPRPSDEIMAAARSLPLFDAAWSQALQDWVTSLGEDRLRDVLAWLSGYLPDALETALCEVTGEPLSEIIPGALDAIEAITDPAGRPDGKPW